MSKESIYKPDRQLIFSETFTSEADCRRNGGVPTAVTFNNGVGVFVGGTNRISYNRFTNQTVSIRVRCTPTNFTAHNLLVDFRSPTSGTGFFYIQNTTGSLIFSSGTGYVNGIASIATSINTINDLVVTGVTAKGWNIRIGLNAMDATPFIGSIELFEIYSGTLSANDVKNLFEGKRLKAPKLDKDEQLGPEMVVNGSFSTDTDWTKLNASWTINNGTANYDKLSLSFITPSVAVPLIVGKRYNISYTISGLSSGAARIGIYNQGGLSSFDLYPAAAISRPNGSYTEIALCILAGTSYYFYAATSSTSAFSIDNLSIKEVLVERTRVIADISAVSGAIANRLSGNYINGNLVPAVVNTAMSVSKQGEVTAMSFNNATSKIDIGSYDPLTSELTILASLRPNSYGEGGLGNIICNGKLVCWISYSNGVRLQSDGSTTVSATAASLKIKQWNRLAITRTSVGVTNFYINGVLVGSANQASGTPSSAATTNIILGNNNGQTATWDGFISDVRVISGILNTYEIAQDYTNTKTKYGL